MGRSESARVMDALRRIVQALRVSSRATERAAGISGAQLFVLHELGERTADSVNELAARVATHQSSVSVVVSRLVEKGFVSRRASESDARRVRLELTEAGRRVAAETPPSAQQRLAAALPRLAARDQEFLAVLLERWLREAGLSDAPAAFFFEETPSVAEERR